MASLRLCKILATALLGLLAASDFSHAGTRPPAPPQALSYDHSIVRVSSTNQAFNINTPWKKESPHTRKGLGTVVEGGRILVTAELIANHNYIELEDHRGEKRCQAIVENVDYDTNLAILKPSEPDFLKDFQPLSLDPDVKLGDSVETLQIENNGSVVPTPGTISSVMVGTYPAEDVTLLLFRVTLPLQYRDNSFVLPAVRKGKLAGILMRYDSHAQFADLIPSPVIQHYLKALDKAPYQSFPRAEISCSGLRDPQLRKYLGITPDLANRGIYITNVIPNGPAAVAGIKEGDVLLAVNGQPLDADGNFNHPLYGLIPFSYITSTEAFAGQKIPFTIFREGKTQDISVQVAPRDIEKMISAPYSIDKAPAYYILGGLVFQELSKSYLHEWGKNWQSEAPKKLVYYDKYQQELPADRGKIVILNQVLANEAAYGYNELNNLVVKSVNGKPIKSLRDLADAVNTPLDGYHRIEFEDEPSVIYLDPELSNRLKESIRQQYNLPALENIPDAKGKIPDNS